MARITKTENQERIKQIDFEVERLRERIPGLRSKFDQEALEERIRILLVERGNLDG